MNETARRLLRTTYALAVALATGIPLAAAAAGLPAVDAAKVAGWCTAIAILVTYVGNALEDRGRKLPGIPRR